MFLGLCSNRLDDHLFTFFTESKIYHGEYWVFFYFTEYECVDEFINFCTTGCAQVNIKDSILLCPRQGASNIERTDQAHFTVKVCHLLIISTHKYHTFAVKNLCLQALLTCATSCSILGVVFLLAACANLTPLPCVTLCLPVK